ncbi:hypothetical protein L3X38_028973 [Prunus dulcis]|uniref:Uncharacterized protein n=1 Tax=Prunus dulcis TaxID=3755 RepID=A0AAD4VRR1_PRUDU|nr:hypothetical protein L3X38_028973 [Prunus dulcis]
MAQVLPIRYRGWLSPPIASGQVGFCIDKISAYPLHRKNRPEPLDPIAIAVAALSIPKNMSHIQRARAYSPYPSLGN